MKERNREGTETREGFVIIHVTAYLHSCALGLGLFLVVGEAVVERQAGKLVMGKDGEGGRSPAQSRWAGRR